MKPLDLRSRTILKEIIRVHVDTRRPVSSRTLFKSNRFHLSPASIRNIMADLTDSGFLTQPHTSAGRVPTDRAYRLHIDELMRHRKIAVDVREQVDSDLTLAGADVPRLFQAASRLLSRLSGEVGFVVAPDALHTVVDGFRFLPVAPGKILVVQMSGPEVLSRVIETEVEYSPKIGGHSTKLIFVVQKSHVCHEVVHRGFQFSINWAKRPDWPRSCELERHNAGTGVPMLRRFAAAPALLG